MVPCDLSSFVPTHGGSGMSAQLGMRPPGVPLALGHQLCWFYGWPSCQAGSDEQVSLLKAGLVWRCLEEDLGVTI